MVRFILAVTVNLNSRARLDDIKAANARFAEFGIAFEAWGPRQLQELSRGEPGIVSQFLGQEWVGRICGDLESDRTAARAADAARDDLENRLAAMAKALSGEAEQKLETARRRLEQGDVSEVETLLRELRTSPTWETLDASARASAVRLQGSVALTRGEIRIAKAFAAEAETIAKASEPRLTALIAMNEQGAEAALDVLGEPTSPQGRSLRASLLLVTGETDEAETVLDQMDPKDPEGLRLRAYLWLLRGDRSEALAWAEKADKADPGHPAISRTLAMALYASALSPLAPSQVALNPNPLNWALVGQDDLSVARLEQALERFLPLADGDPLRASRELDAAWVLACLANLPSRRKDAAAQARRLLAADLRDIQAIGWVLMRDLDVDLALSRQTLLDALRAGTLQSGEIVALDWLTAPQDTPSLLATIETALEEGIDDANLAQEVAGVRDRLRGAPTGDDIGPAVLETARDTGDWTQAEADFEAAITAEPPPFTVISLASALSASERWTVLDRHRDRLLGFATAVGVRIAAIAAYNVGDPVGALAILKDGAQRFPGGTLPFTLRRVEAESLAQVG